MDKKKFDPDDLQVIKAKIDLYKATIESLKKEHLAYQEILCQHGHYQTKEEVIPLNKFHNKDEHLENEYYEEEEYMESEYYDEEEHLESEYQDEDYMENEQLEENNYFTEQFDYLHGYLNELGQELLSLNKKIVLILKKQDQLLKNNELKEIKEEIASLKKSLQPKETPAPPATKAPQGFSQLRNMVRSNSHVYDPNEQSRFQGLGNYPSPPRNYPSNSMQQGTSKGRRPLSPSKKSKTVKSNKLNSPKQRATSSRKPPKSEGTTIKRKDEPDANLQTASMEINQRPAESALTDVKQVQEEILTNAQVKNNNMSKPKFLKTEAPSVVNTNSIPNEEPLSIKEEVTSQPTSTDTEPGEVINSNSIPIKEPLTGKEEVTAQHSPTDTEPGESINTNSTPNKEPLTGKEEVTAQHYPTDTEPGESINTNSTPNKEPLTGKEEVKVQPTPTEAELEDDINTNSTPNKEPLHEKKEVTIESPVSQPETVHVGNKGISGTNHLPVKDKKVMEPSSPETRLINAPIEELEVHKEPIIEKSLEEPKENKEMNSEEKKLEKSFEATTKNMETQRKPPVNSFFSLFQRG
ncbi:hypothetical protein [Halobacillus sp. K22]|uniref:hypothetical protein n=1 Tax=Halobacillus sp. K22 TaxID=3457431 RepID=UPI003FCCEEEE